jgi:hypothetical protein
MHPCDGQREQDAHLETHRRVISHAQKVLADCANGLRGAKEMRGVWALPAMFSFAVIFRAAERDFGQTVILPEKSVSCSMILVVDSDL